MNIQNYANLTNVFDNNRPPFDQQNFVNFQLSNLNSTIAQLRHEITNLTTKNNDLGKQLQKTKSDKDVEVNHLKQEIHRLKEQLAIYANSYPSTSVAAQQPYQAGFQPRPMEQAGVMFYVHQQSDYPDVRSPNEIMMEFFNQPNPGMGQSQTNGHVGSQPQASTSHALEYYANPNMASVNHTPPATSQTSTSKSKQHRPTIVEAINNMTQKTPGSRGPRNPRPDKHPLLAIPYANLTPEQKKLRNKIMYQRVNKPRKENLTAEEREREKAQRYESFKRRMARMTDEEKAAKTKRDNINSMNRKARKRGFPNYETWKAHRDQEMEKKAKELGFGSIEEYKKIPRHLRIKGKAYMERRKQEKEELARSRGFESYEEFKKYPKCIRSRGKEASERYVKKHGWSKKTEKKKKNKSKKKKNSNDSDSGTSESEAGTSSSEDEVEEIVTTPLAKVTPKKKTNRLQIKLKVNRQKNTSIKPTYGPQVDEQPPEEATPTSNPLNKTKRPVPKRASRDHSKFKARLKACIDADNKSEDDIPVSMVTPEEGASKKKRVVKKPKKIVTIEDQLHSVVPINISLNIEDDNDFLATIQ